MQSRTYDLFISYSRRDNQSGRITEFVDRISRDFESFAGRPLRPFFDIKEIHGMDDWRHRILQGLRESRLLVACLSPSLLASEYCAWEFYEYANNEVARALVSEGVAPNWANKHFDNALPEKVVIRPLEVSGDHKYQAEDVPRQADLKIALLRISFLN
jgi:hypothetical protein